MLALLQLRVFGSETGGGDKDDEKEEEREFEFGSHCCCREVKENGGRVWGLYEGSCGLMRED